MAVISVQVRALVALRTIVAMSAIQKTRTSVRTNALLAQRKALIALLVTSRLNLVIVVSQVKSQSRAMLVIAMQNVITTVNVKIALAKNLK